MAKPSVNKAEFVRLHPTLTPKDLVALASKSGIKFSAKYVYTVRWKTAAKSFDTAMGKRGNAKAKSVVVRVPADVGKAFVARRKAAKKAAQAVPLEEPKVIALTYKSNLTKDDKGGWQVATTGPVPASEVVPATRDRHFKQLALEIGLAQAYVLLAELRASVLPPA